MSTTPRGLVPGSLLNEVIFEDPAHMLAIEITPDGDRRLKMYNILGVRLGSETTITLPTYVADAVFTTRVGDPFLGLQGQHYTAIYDAEGGYDSPILRAGAKNPNGVIALPLLIQEQIALPVSEWIKDSYENEEIDRQVLENKVEEYLLLIFNAEEARKSEEAFQFLCDAVEDIVEQKKKDRQLAEERDLIEDTEAQEESEYDEEQRVQALIIDALGRENEMIAMELEQLKLEQEEVELQLREIEEQQQEIEQQRTEIEKIIAKEEQAINSIIVSSLLSGKHLKEIQAQVFNREGDQVPMSKMEQLLLQEMVAEIVRKKIAAFREQLASGAIKFDSTPERLDRHTKAEKERDTSASATIENTTPQGDQTRFGQVVDTMRTVLKAGRAWIDSVKGNTEEPVDVPLSSRVALEKLDGQQDGGVSVSDLLSRRDTVGDTSGSVMVDLPTRDTPVEFEQEVVDRLHDHLDMHIDGLMANLDLGAMIQSGFSTVENTGLLKKKESLVEGVEERQRMAADETEAIDEACAPILVSMPKLTASWGTIFSAMAQGHSLSQMHKDLGSRKGEEETHLERCRGQLCKQSAHQDKVQHQLEAVMINRELPDIIVEPPS